MLARIGVPVAVPEAPQPRVFGKVPNRSDCQLGKLWPAPDVNTCRG